MNGFNQARVVQFSRLCPFIRATSNQHLLAVFIPDSIKRFQLKIVEEKNKTKHLCFWLEEKKNISTMRSNEMVVFLAYQSEPRLWAADQQN